MAAKKAAVKSRRGNSGKTRSGSAKKRPRGRPFVKGESGNPAGRPPGRRSFRKHFEEAFDDSTREKISRSFAAKARAGSIAHFEIALKVLGEGADTQPNAGQGNQFATLILGDSAARELAQQLFAALAMGVRDAGGSGLVRERAALDSGETSDAGE